MTLTIDRFTPKTERPLLPQRVTFTNSKEEAVAKLYFKNNPWKLSPVDDHRKFFLHCIVCGDKRFSDKEWRVNWFRTPSNWQGHATICRAKESCHKTFELIRELVPVNHYWLEDASEAVGVLLRRNEIVDKIDDTVRFEDSIKLKSKL